MNQDEVSSTVETPLTSSFVWWSTDWSVRQGIPSALALLEVIVAVALYWAVAIYFHTSTHLWLSIIIAPLLLLRSTRSTSLGVKWFASYLAGRNASEPISVNSTVQSRKFWVGLLIALTTSSVASSVSAPHQILSYPGVFPYFVGGLLGFLIMVFGMASVEAATLTVPEGFSSPRLGALIGAIAGMTIIAGKEIAVLGLLVFALTALLALVSWSITTERPTTSKINTIFLPLISSGNVIGIWIRTILIRFGATVLHLPQGFRQLPNNFRHALFVVDLRNSAELVPGYSDISFFTSHGLLERMKARTSLLRKGDDLTAYLILFVPAYAYRLSIKSTCWLYLPLVYVASARYAYLSPSHLLDRLDYSPWERLRRYLAFGTLVLFVLVTVLHNLSIAPRLFEVKSVSPIEFLFLVDFQFWKRPWQLCSLVGAFITIYLIGATGQARVDLGHAIDSPGKIFLVREIETIKLLMRGRDVFSAMLVVILFVHALLLFSPIMYYLPDYILNGFSWFYGAYMPPQTH